MTEYYLWLLVAWWLIADWLEEMLWCMLPIRFKVGKWMVYVEKKVK